MTDERSDLLGTNKYFEPLVREVKTDSNIQSAISGESYFCKECKHRYSSTEGHVCSAAINATEISQAPFKFEECNVHFNTKTDILAPTCSTNQTTAFARNEGDSRKNIQNLKGKDRKETSEIPNQSVIHNVPSEQEESVKNLNRRVREGIPCDHAETEYLVIPCDPNAFTIDSSRIDLGKTSETVNTPAIDIATNDPVENLYVLNTSAIETVTSQNAKTFQISNQSVVNAAPSNNLKASHIRSPSIFSNKRHKGGVLQIRKPSTVYLPIGGGSTSETLNTSVNYLFSNDSIQQLLAPQTRCCNKTYGHKGSLRPHIKRFHCFTCIHCQKTFTSEQSCLKHTASHKQAASYKHTASHTNYSEHGKPTRKLCLRGFVSEENLIRHNRKTHQGKQKYECEICKTKFSSITGHAGHSSRCRNNLNKQKNEIPKSK